MRALKGSEMDLVSVIIPAQNRPQMLRQAVLSVVAQTYKPIEIIIVLAGATEQVIGMASDIASEHGARLFVGEAECRGRPKRRTFHSSWRMDIVSRR